MTPTVYIYATDSHTETSIKDFLRKINSEITWIPRSPRQAKRPKKDYAIKDVLPVLTGRTGLDLENFMIEEIDMHPIIVLECPAILLEDDLDRRDAFVDQNEYLTEQHKRLSDKIKNIVHGVSAELICLYAAPEIETWLIEDWENSFGNAKLFNQQIATQLRPLINKMKDECGGSFEHYSHYRDNKFSDWLIDNIQSLSEKYRIENHEMASYSKSKHGSRFLGEIDPVKIEPKCRVYFSKAYHAIQRIV